MIGFLAGKVYYLALAFGHRVLSRGEVRKGLLIAGAVTIFVFWVYSALLYVGSLYFPWPFPMWVGGTNWMLNSGLPLGLARTPTTDLVAVVIFATYPIWFYLGTELGKSGHRLTKVQRRTESARILRDLAQAEFPEGGAIPPSADDVDVASSLEDLLKKIPPLYADAITTLLFVFDSRFLVFPFTGKWKRFVALSPEERERYLRAWESNSFLVTVAQILKITCSYGYYTKPPVYTVFQYNGPMTPNLPPWYRPGPEASK